MTDEKNLGEAGAVADVAAYPNIRRVGAYAFFAWLAFWATMPIYALGRWLELPRDMTSLASTIVMVTSFLALRDMLEMSPAGVFGGKEAAGG